MKTLYCFLLTSVILSSCIRTAKQTDESLSTQAKQDSIAFSDAFLMGFMPDRIKNIVLITPVKDSSFSIERIKKPYMIVWKPNNKETAFMESDDGNCYTTLDTVLYYTAVDGAVRAVLVYATYTLSGGEKESCHACAPTVSIAVMKKGEQNGWSLEKFERDFGYKGIYGIMPAISLTKFGNDYFIENETFNEGMAIQSSGSAFYHLPNLVFSIKTGSVIATAEGGNTEKENWVESITDISQGDITKILFTKKGTGYEQGRGQFQIDERKEYILNREGVFEPLIK